MRSSQGSLDIRISVAECSLREESLKLVRAELDWGDTGEATVDVIEARSRVLDACRKLGNLLRERDAKLARERARDNAAAYSVPSKGSRR